MDRVWDRHQVMTVRDIYADLADNRQIAYTTVLSTMDNLHRKGWLARERFGKAFHYWSTLSREGHSAKLMGAAFESGGDTDLVLTHFLEQMPDDESGRVRAALHRIIDGPTS